MSASLTGQLRVLTLNRGEKKEATLYRLEKGWTLHFVLGVTLADKDVRLFVNHPQTSKAGPDRHKFRELTWKNYSHSKALYDSYAEVPITCAGSFNYYFTINDSDNQKVADGSGYFLVEPVLRSGLHDMKMPLDSITCQTVLSKLLGPFPEWEDRLRVAKECGYNMIHFTPLQELGASNSCYSLASQSKLNPAFSSGDKVYDFTDVAILVNKMAKEWGVLSLTDLVLNHTANETVWIKDHPECVYNVVNNPHLKPAYILDRGLWHLTLEVAEGMWEHKGLPSKIQSEEHLAALQNIIVDRLLPKLRIHEFYMIHIEDTVRSFQNAMTDAVAQSDRGSTQLQIIPDPNYRRLKATVDIPLALNLFGRNRLNGGQEKEVEECCAEFQACLESLNAAQFHIIQNHLEAAVNNVLANARWRFVSPDGDNLKTVTSKAPIMHNYFVLPNGKMTLDEEEATMYTDQGRFCFAHNGWVMGDDPLRNFAEPGSNVYLRRELIPWGDSVKLCYGEKVEDCPYLWEHMRQYACFAASIFHGIRLDNCHSTPIHVAEYLLDEARKIRPDLYVIAELFTSSEFMDGVFINRLGLSSLIRESLSAWDSHEQGRLVHRYGGQPVGAFIQPPARPLMPSMAHAIFFDQTHDNPSPIEKRSAYDILPSAAMVAMACCATGSNRGFDELVPHHVNVVTEHRFYKSWTDKSKAETGFINTAVGIVAAKKTLNMLHRELAEGNKGSAAYNQVFVDQVDQDIVSITRHDPVSHRSVILVSRTAFSKDSSESNTGYIKPLCIEGQISEIIVEGRIVQHTKDIIFKKDEFYINGLDDYSLEMREHLQINKSNMVRITKTDDMKSLNLHFVNFPPGSIIAFRVSQHQDTKAAVMALRQGLQQFGYRMHTYSGRNLQQICVNDLEDIVSRMSFDDLNRALFRCHQEEVGDGTGSGAYHIPGYGDLTYCGLQGVMSILNNIRAENDLGHPLCENLRNGNWLCHYIPNRLKFFPGTKALGEWLDEMLLPLSKIPRFLIPSYFDAILTGTFLVLEEVAWAKMSQFVMRSSSFTRNLAMGSLQFCSYMKTSPLPSLSENLLPPPPSRKDDQTGTIVQCCSSLAAGMPHFVSGIFRNWGRDTFISMRGLLLLTGRFSEARNIILAYAGCLRHGLIPNLLGSGLSARYNCRDAVWWWLQAIQDYTQLAPNGTAILSDIVLRMYPTDESHSDDPGKKEQPLHDVIQEALQRHAEGCKYRERNAGQTIDNHMTDEGFNIEMGVNWSTGFVFGGNIHNCGTWMDKMGSSNYAGNLGKPATPRDGSGVELVGLCKSATRWLADQHAEGNYPYDGVKRNQKEEKIKVTFEEWSSLIQRNFEQYFWVDDVAVEKDMKPEMINKRHIYKDSHGASQPWADYQLRPNFTIALVVAPELVMPHNAWKALDTAEKHLLGPLGMKTLDPSDWAYNGDYINDDVSADPKRAQGFNYHQGPEWLWPLGYFLRAKLYYAGQLDDEQPGLLLRTIKFIKSTLSNHNVHIHNSVWRSLPELTNRDGAVCNHSCEAQAWSVGCLLEVLYDVEAISHQSDI